MKKQRCGWCLGDSEYQAYHDMEWGVPVHDDRVFFEFLLLESFQAGLSWITILRKRENFRKAFDNFDFERIAKYGPAKQEALLKDAGIVRNRLKVAATVTNAQAYIELRESHGSFTEYIWGFVNNLPVKNAFAQYKDAPPRTALSDSIAKDLKKKGFKFMGSTVVYAFMQATGLINDHETSCFRYDEV